MDKKHIIQEIQRTAGLNGGLPLGRQRFLKETGLKEYDLGKHWSLWSEAVRDAGFSPNALQAPYDESVLLEKYIGLVRELGRLPTPSDIVLKSRNATGFPSEATFRARYGPKSGLVKGLLKYCDGRPGYADIIPLCTAYGARKNGITQELEPGVVREGYVYLLQHGTRREYKIGKTFNPIRREGEIALQLPERLEPVHHIKTDDPSGLERYWHMRFAAKRMEGEWFVLSSDDVRAFKRWIKIY